MSEEDKFGFVRRKCCAKCEGVGYVPVLAIDPECSTQVSHTTEKCEACNGTGEADGNGSFEKIQKHKDMGHELFQCVEQLYSALTLRIKVGIPSLKEAEIVYRAERLLKEGDDV